MYDPKIRQETMIRRLREAGCRITPQRLFIFKILSKSRDHPSVEKVYEQVKPVFPTTSLATVYKNVAILKELGEVLELVFSNESNRYDGNRPHPHPHLICTKCKKILDPDLASLKDVTSELTRETGFKIVNHRLDFFGICPECQKKE
jgi:Fur family peroxide stress response transcriptional regulator